jgi:hypothetical protein
MQTFTILFKSRLSGEVYVWVIRRSSKQAAMLAAYGYAHFVGSGFPLHFIFV